MNEKTQQLVNAVDEFAAKMKARLIEMDDKILSDFRKTTSEDIAEHIENKAAWYRNKLDHIDIANWCLIDYVNNKGE